MTRVFADKALLAGGWERAVRLTIDDGVVTGVETGARPAGDDSRFAVVTPGFVNAHSHAFQRALVGRAESRALNTADTFWTWRHLMYRLAARLDAGLLRPIAAQLYSEMLAAGYTTVVEFHYLLGGSGDTDDADALLEALADAAELAGIRLVYLPVLYERGGFDGALPSREQQGFLRSPEQLLAHADDARRLLGRRHRVGIGAHSLRAVTPASLTAIAAYAAEQHMPVHMHVAEQRREVDECQAAVGRRPVAWLLDHCPVDARWTLVHATHMDDTEVAALATSGATACLCPSTEGNLGDGLFRLADYLAAGGRIAIGSDSHVTVDPFEELRWLEYGARLASGERNVAAVGDYSAAGDSLIRRVIDGGACAAGFEQSGLEAGAPADLLVLDGDGGVLTGHEEATLLNALVFSGQPGPIVQVMVAGEWRLRDGRHPAADDILEAYRAAVRAVQDRQAGA